MNVRSIPWVLAVLLATAGCSAPVEQDASSATEGSEDPPGDFLPRPFTADQIREAWGAGLVLRIRQSSPELVEHQRWTVVSADDEGAEIEYIAVDENGLALSEPRIERTSWQEFRDHASFPVATARRERSRQNTALGTLEGWLYTVEDRGTGTVGEFFFVDSLPGAPLFARTKRDGQLVAEMAQIERNRP